MTTTATTTTTTTTTTIITMVFRLAILVLLVSSSLVTAGAFRGGGLRNDFQQGLRKLPAISTTTGGSMTSFGGITQQQIRASTLLRGGRGDGGGPFSGNTDINPFHPNDNDNNLISCTHNGLAAQAREDVQDQFFTYEGNLDFTNSAVGDVLQLAVFFAYRDEVVCQGEGAQRELDSNFFMFGHDRQLSSSPSSSSSSLPDGVNIDRSFFLMTFNLACNVCPVQQDGCGVAVFSEGNVVEQQRDSTTTTTTCFCTPPTREAFLGNLNERLQQDNYLGLFDGVMVTDVMDIVVTPSPPSQGDNNAVVSRNTPGLGLDWPLLIRPTPAGCFQSSPTQGPFAGLVTAPSTTATTEANSGILGDGNNQQEVDCTTPVVKIEGGVPTLLCE